MLSLEQIKEIVVPSEAKIVVLIMDGLGGLPHPETNKTELETAKTPNLDALAKRGICGLSEPIGPGITPGSGPGHLAIFGYDPLVCTIGRGILEALGIDFPLEEGDVAARGNFCTVDDEGLVTDRRAGRIPTEKAAELCQQLARIQLAGIKALISPVEGHRFLLVLRGNNLDPELSDSDPQQLGVPPREISPMRPEAAETAALANKWVAKAREILKDSRPANMVLLRGFSQRPSFPTMSQVYGLNPVAVATYPMYRGVAKMIGMKVPEAGHSIKDQFDTVVKHYGAHDFFFLHIKQTDTAGEDGDFDRKVRVIEEVDAALPRLLELKPDVVVVTGDHSTPALLKGHSWHPVPFLLSAKYCRPDAVTEFSENGCARGSLGTFPALSIMPLAMANALRLTKYGA